MHDMLLVVAGLTGIYAEFIRPGKVVPAVAGAILLTLGIAGMVQGPIDWTAVLLLGTPFTLITIVLLAIAWRARRNKTSY